MIDLLKLKALASAMPETDTGLYAMWNELMPATVLELIALVEHQEAELAAARAPAAAVQVEVCPACGGSGEVSGLVGGGPDAYEESATCPHCNGTGALEDAYNGVVALLSVERAEVTELLAKLQISAAVVQVDALTDEQSEAILLNMAVHVDEWSEGLDHEPTSAECNGEALRFILAAARPAAPVQPDLRQTQAETLMWLNHIINANGFEYSSLEAMSQAMRTFARNAKAGLAAPVQAAPEGEVVLQARLPEETAWEDVTQVVYDHASANGFEVRKLYAAAPAPGSAAEPQTPTESQRSIILGQAVAHCNGAWPADLSSGIMFFNGQRITLAEFNERAKLAGYSPRSAA